LRQISSRFLLFFIFSIVIFATEQAEVSFKAKDLNGKSFVLAENLGEGPVIITFWALWCSSCIKELMALDKTLSPYFEKGLKIIAVNNDSPKSLAKVKSFVRMKKWKFPVLLDSNQKIRKQFGGTQIPFMLILDSNGKIVSKHNSYQPGDEKKIEKEIIELLPKATENE